MSKINRFRWVMSIRMAHFLQYKMSFPMVANSFDKSLFSMFIEGSGHIKILAKASLLKMDLSNDITNGFSGIN